jgi:hypothetical protein
MEITVNVIAKGFRIGPTSATVKVAKWIWPAAVDAIVRRAR